MKRWVLLTLLLYFLSLSILTVPILTIFNEEADLLLSFFVFMVPALLLIQIILLLIPLDVVRERPVKKRKAVTSVIFGAIPMAVLVLFFVWSMANLIWGESALDPFITNVSILLTIGISWICWGLLFFRAHSSKNPDSLTQCITKWLLRGSILEMIIAIPAHIVARHREECCAPPITLIGISTGLAVALMSFGPGIFFLFAKRMQLKRGKKV